VEGQELFSLKRKGGPTLFLGKKYQNSPAPPPPQKKTYLSYKENKKGSRVGVFKVVYTTKFWIWVNRASFENRIQLCIFAVYFRISGHPYNGCKILELHHLKRSASVHCWV